MHIYHSIKFHYIKLLRQVVKNDTRFFLGKLPNGDYH